MCCGSEGAAATGPEVDVEFFAALRRVFEQYPNAKEKYGIEAVPSAADLEAVGVDFATHVGVTRYGSGRIITTFHPRDEIEPRRVYCCKWDSDNNCTRTCGDPEM